MADRAEWQQALATADNIEDGLADMKALSRPRRAFAITGSLSIKTLMDSQTAVRPPPVAGSKRKRSSTALSAIPKLTHSETTATTPSPLGSPLSSVPSDLSDVDEDSLSSERGAGPTTPAPRTKRIEPVSEALGGAKDAVVPAEPSASNTKSTGRNKKALAGRDKRVGAATAVRKTTKASKPSSLLPKEQLQSRKATRQDGAKSEKVVEVKASSSTSASRQGSKPGVVVSKYFTQQAGVKLSKNRKPVRLTQGPAVSVATDAAVTTPNEPVAPWLAELPQKLSIVPSGQPLPDPVGQPLVWADQRQALCETVPYYRSFQGGCYHSNRSVYAFMFDGESHAREYMDSDVVLLRAGGGMGKDKDSGERTQSEDQTESAQVVALRNNIGQFNPVVLIVGENNPKAPSKVPHSYCVLDWFKPTHIWYEKSKGRKLIRYRFEKLRPDEQSWWAPQGREEPIKFGSLPPPHIEACPACKIDSPQVYIQGWMCLEPTCARFWKLKSGAEPNEPSLAYDPRFVKQKTIWPHSSAPYSLKPDLMQLDAAPLLGQNVSWEAWKGLACPQCGRCSSREAWIGWQCGNPACNFTHELPHALIPARALHDIYHPLSSSYAFSRDLHEPGITFQLEFANNYRRNRYVIPGVEDFVEHWIANKTVNEETGGPDDMWEELQTQDVGLRRRRLEGEQIKGGMLTMHFTVNYGMPYKFVAATSSLGFDEACNAIKGTRSRLNWAARCVAGGAHTEFNELLALGYFEKQKINYHDDGEKGLGPTIATLSLGYPATMRLRMKGKHFRGASKMGVWVEDEPMPGCEHYEERRAAWQELQSMDKKAAAARKKALPTELKLRKTGDAPVVIQMHLGHGDIVIMHGAKIQKYYEHAVEPHGNLRFALTCRYIDPDSLAEADKPQYEVRPDDGFYDGSSLPLPPQ
ncbi:hypothetical protein H2201_003603 [Coniosporium apollinis]|uniref:Alpha-ketoglutarate-dependent dioxygenase AlkB-like domain-containing protein n=1 Tax=Coniosporium apollinis TaxID=61459 RepID=A0ABQ9NUV3_9PEZI|nr:hypothetical protein H2201_003603 [Coniosporium apollinis]